MGVFLAFGVISFAACLGTVAYRFANLDLQDVGARDLQVVSNSNMIVIDLAAGSLFAVVWGVRGGWLRRAKSKQAKQGGSASAKTLQLTHRFVPSE
jgi:hypothetical protein